MGEIDELDDPVDHRVAERDQRVDAAVGDGEREDLKEERPALGKDLRAEKDQEYGDDRYEREVEDATGSPGTKTASASPDRLADRPHFPLARKGRGRLRAPSGLRFLELAHPPTENCFTKTQSLAAVWYW